MKKIIIASAFVLGIISFGLAQEKAIIQDTKAPKLVFEKTQHDFGSIEEGTQATIQFKFINKGNADALLTSVKASCGCTTPKWTKEPIPPGGEGYITAIYNSRGRPGNFVKTITVKSNSQNGTDHLTIKGFVKTMPKEPTSPVINN
ncbi:MAG: DUF1573 domain-containing protein [Bacteroidota bacterium]|nr:DUF1573 domain-containing protein [Bacteroidota bacterium]